MFEFLISFSVTFLAIPVCIRIARRFEIVDRPDGALKPHTESIPYLAGVAIYLGLFPFIKDVVTMIVLTSLCIIGLIDDIRRISPFVRLVAEFTCAVIFSLQISASFGERVLWVFMFTLIINGVNMIDGMDGICAAVIATASVFFVFDGSSGLVMAILGVCLSYLVYNFPPARVFMGDSGSYLLGGAAMYIIAYTRGSSGFVQSFSPFFLIILDLSSGVIRRILAGQSPLLGDRDHLYDKIFRTMRGKKITRSRKTVLVMVMLTLVSGFLGRITQPWNVLSLSILSVLLIAKLKLFYQQRGGK